MKILTGLFIILLLPAWSVLQTKDITAAKNSLQKGSWGVQFQIGSNFTLSSFENVIVSLKTHFSPRLAVRFGVGLNASNNQQELDYKEYYYGYSGTDIHTNNNYVSVTLLAKILYYVNPKSNINLFIGLGPLGIYSHNYHERYYLDGYLGYGEDNSWSAGLNAVIGCEVFPVNFLSLFAEYSAASTFGKGTENNYVKNVNTGAIEEFRNIESTTLNFTGNTVRFGLSLYF